MLPAATSLHAALAALRGAVAALPAEAGAYASGLVRLEVPVPRGVRPLWWLRGQAAPPANAAKATPPMAQQAAQLHPRIYFSPRRTTAADTEGSAAAGAAGAGAGSVAGAGAAWLWRGAPGEPLDDDAVRDMQRFLGAGATRVRAFGGARFNAAQAPAPEWAEFGSYCFLIPRCAGGGAAEVCDMYASTRVGREGARWLLPGTRPACCRLWHWHAFNTRANLPTAPAAVRCRVEFLEASGCNLLACTVAWDATHASGGGSGGGGGGSSAPLAAVGFSSAEEAAADALAALGAVQPAAAPAAGAFKLQRHASAHVPDEPGWRQLMDGTHAGLAALAPEAAAAAAAAAQLAEACEASGGQPDACTPLLKICPDTAREEYLLNGQEGLDDLLTALDGGFGFEASATPEVGGGWGGLGCAAVGRGAAHTAWGAQPLWPASRFAARMAWLPLPTPCPPLCLLVGAPCCRTAGSPRCLPLACDRPHCRCIACSCFPLASSPACRLTCPGLAALLQDGGLTKVVLARRTDVSITGRLDPLSLLEALGERDPRAYQIMLQVSAGGRAVGCWYGNFRF